MAQYSFGPVKYEERGRPVLWWYHSLSCRSVKWLITSSPRQSIHTMALYRGIPVVLCISSEDSDGLVPHHERFSLIRNTHGGKRRKGYRTLLQAARDARLHVIAYVFVHFHTLQNRHGIVLHPSGMGIDLLVLLLRHTDNGTIVIEHDKARTRMNWHAHCSYLVVP